MKPPLHFSVQMCDLYFARNNGIISRAIRICEQGWSEGKSEASHVGGFVTGGYWDEAMGLEALNRVVRHNFAGTYAGTGTEILIARPLNLTMEQRFSIVAAAEQYIGDRYGYAKIIAHLLDAGLGGANVFRRLCRANKWPICSWVWASAFKSAGLDFGCDAKIATPDDMLDFIRANSTTGEVSTPDAVPKYAILREWEAL